MLTVRESTPGDESEAAVVDRLSTADLRKIYRPTAAAHERRSSISANLQRLVALRDGQVVGTVQYHIDAGCLYLLGLGVHPDFRRRGVATALVQRLEEVAAESGCHGVVLHTVLETGNVAIFERMGFVIESQQPTGLFESDAFPMLTEVVMRLVR
jgi:N-acetylglutamate synthase-like GNAT family acetyltransferase